MTDLDLRLIELAERIYPDATDPVARELCEAIFRLEAGGAHGGDSASSNTLDVGVCLSSESPSSSPPRSGYALQPANVEGNGLQGEVTGR